MAALSQGRLSVDPEQHVAEFAGTPLRLTAIEFGMLRAFLTRPTLVFSRDQIMSAAYQLKIPGVGSHHRQPHPQYPRQAVRREFATMSLKPFMVSASSSGDASRRHDAPHTREMAAIGRAGHFYRACRCGDAAFGRTVLLSPHLTDNAIRHNAKRVRLEAVQDNGSIKMTVSNDGDPISEPNREKIFDAFFTTRRDTGGTGMGLSIVQAVMTSHGGSIRLLPSDQGAAFELQFPAAKHSVSSEVATGSRQKTRQTKAG